MSSLVAASGPLRGASARPRPGGEQTGLRHAPGTATVAAVCVAAVLALSIAGCGGQAAVALPRKTSLPAVPAAASGPTPAVNGQVVAAYTGYWQALGQALDARNATQARVILAQFASPALIPSLVSGLETDWARGEIQYGAPVPHILSVQITGDKATVHDCADFSHAGVQKAATGQVVGSLGNPRVNMISVLVLSGGRWLLSNQVPVVASCTP
jgi:hypothetical protein